MRAFSLLSISLFALSAAAKTTIIGFETEMGSRSVQAPLDDCFDLDADDFLQTLYLSKKCRVFTGPMCTGRTTVLEPGEHAVEEPVPVGSVFCEEVSGVKLEL